MLYCLQLALIMLSIIYISFLVHRKTVSDLVHLKASREYPCECFSTRSIHDASLPYSLSGTGACRIMELAWCSAYNACMADYIHGGDGT